VATSKRAEIWSTARKFETELKPVDQQMRVAETNPRRLTEHANNYHNKYLELNLKFNSKKPIAIVNPINHEISFT
jgi:hypothetical protein